VTLLLTCPPGAPRRASRGADAILALLLILACRAAVAAGLPPPVARAFADAHIPLSAVSAYVQELGDAQPLIAHDVAQPRNPASTMKLVTTFAALELLGPAYRWRTEVYADGPIRNGVLDGNLVLKGYGDPKITIEQFTDLVNKLRATGLISIRGDLVLDRTEFALQPHDPAAFDGEPLKPYNVGPDALLLSFKSVRFVFTPSPENATVEVTVEPPIANLRIGARPRLVAGDCGDWHAELRAVFIDRHDAAEASFPGSFPASCGERDWYVALLDHAQFVRATFALMWGGAGGSFSGRVRDGKVPAGVKPIAVLESPPLYDVVRDINKMSNNVMARQLFLTLATTSYPPPATTERAAATVKRWLASQKLAFPELVLDNGSGLSRRERIAARSMGRLLNAAYASDVQADYVSSLAVAATDGTVRKRYENETVAEQAFLKTGSLEGVRAIAGYVFTPDGRRFVVVCMVNHANAARAQPALDLLVEWVYAVGGNTRSR
jgi:D-alanyl-D-alanine carboxypeptidase/D-alanyl-D-alanine-endopeptidase (penicillin-binding protein 4)